MDFHVLRARKTKEKKKGSEIKEINFFSFFFGWKKSQAFSGPSPR